MQLTLLNINFLKTYIMKTIILGLSVFLFSVGLKAQNTNIKDETKTTTTTITNSDGEKKYVKKENTREVQDIELQNPKPNTVNVEMKSSPVEVTSSTKITNPDGSTRTVSIDRSGNYELRGYKFNLALDANGYRILSKDMKISGLLRKTSTNTFIYRNGKRNAIGYFDVSGNLVLENYNPKSDSVTYEVYRAIK